MRRQPSAFIAATILAVALAPHPAAAQVIDLHAANSVETERQSTSWGGGIGVGTVYLPAGPATLGLALGADYIREQHLGKSLVTTALDATLSPSRFSDVVVPYLGGSAGLNWSGGQYTQWKGARWGLHAIVGVKALLGIGQRIGWKVEERFGYVQGFEHAYATRVGILIGL